MISADDLDDSDFDPIEEPIPEPVLTKPSPMYYFTDPKFIGKSYTVQGTTIAFRYMEEVHRNYSDAIWPTRRTTG